MKLLLGVVQGWLWEQGEHTLQGVCTGSPEHLVLLCQGLSSPGQSLWPWSCFCGVLAPVTGATTLHGWETTKSCSVSAGSSGKVWYLVQHPRQLQGLQAGHSPGNTDITVLTTCVHLSPVTLSPNYGISKKQVVHFAWSASTPTHVLLELLII